MIKSYVRVENEVVGNENSIRLTPTPPPGMEVFIPPDIRYWASGDVNSTVLDKLGLPWFCYTAQQTHCVPLFRKPPNYRTTRMPGRKPKQTSRVI